MRAASGATTTRSAPGAGATTPATRDTAVMAPRTAAAVVTGTGA
jgi:hypothetical protein